MEVMSMANKEYLKPMVTPRGVAYYAFLTKPGKKYQSEDKEFKTTLEFDVNSPEWQKFQTDVNQVFESEKAKNLDEMKAKYKSAKKMEAATNAWFKTHEDNADIPEGKAWVRFTKNAVTKKGNKGCVKVIDSKKNVIKDPNFSVGNGSVLRVSFTPSFYFTPQSWGLKLYLDAAMVIEHTPYEMGADTSIFDVEDGFDFEGSSFEDLASEAFDEEGVTSADDDEATDANW
jgi:hypothetical protein